MTIPTVPMQLMVETKERKADLYVNGDITSGFTFWGMKIKNEDDISYKDVAEALADLPEEVDDIYVHINSYGGEVAEGIAIYNALKSNKAKVTTVCEGFACSIASVVFMAGDVRVMREASLLMLHNASMPANGDAASHRKAADTLDTVTELSRTAYLAHATEALTREKLVEVMDAETWVSPETALEWGLATEIDREEDEDEDNPSQSARGAVAKALLEPPVMAELVSEPFDVEALARETAEYLVQLLPHKTVATISPEGVVIESTSSVTPKAPDQFDNDSHARFSRLFGMLANNQEG